MDPTDQLLTTAQLERDYGIPEATWRWWRHKNLGPRAFRVGSRKVMYRRSDVLAWLDQQYAADEPTGSNGGHAA